MGIGDKDYELQKIDSSSEQKDIVDRTYELKDEMVVRDSDADKKLNRQITFVQKIFPNKEDKETVEYQVNMLKQRSKANQENHRMFFEFQRQVLKTALDKVLVEGKQKVISERNAHFAKRRIELEELLLKLQDRQTQKFDEEYEKLSQIKSDKVRKTREKLLDNLLEKFIEEIEELIENYRSIIKELV